MTAWVKLYLQAEQKKGDFKPETDDFDTVSSPVSERFIKLNKFTGYHRVEIVCNIILGL